MNIIAIDSNKSDLRKLKKAIQKAIPGCSLSIFERTNDALEYANANRVDVVFLEIVIDGCCYGIELARKMKKIRFTTNFIFVTASKNDYYAIEAFTVNASHYIMKPITTELVTEGMNKLFYPIEESI